MELPKTISSETGKPRIAVRMIGLSSKALENYRSKASARADIRAWVERAW